MSYNTIIIPLDQALQDYAVAWQLLVEAEALEPTQMPGWVEAICKAFEVYDSVEVWCALDDQKELMSIIPFLRKQNTMYGIPVKSIELITNIISYHNIPSGTPRDPALFTLFLETIDQWDMCIVPNLIVDNPAYPELLHVLHSQKHFVHELATVASPYIEISTDWDEYLTTRSGSFRYRLQRKAKAVAKAGDIAIRWYSDEFDSEQLLKDILTIEANSWKVEAGMAISHRPVEQRYYEQLIPFMATNGLLMANVLSIDGNPAAYGLCYNFKQRWGQLKTSFDDQYKAYSPGKHLVDLSVEQAFKEGAREFDFLGDRMRHKLEWTDQVRNHNNLYIYNSSSLSGKLTGVVKRLSTRIKAFSKTSKKT